MERNTRTAEATQPELAAIAEVLAANDLTPSQLSEGVQQRIIRQGPSLRTYLLPALNALKDAVGWISQGAVEELSEQLRIPRADIYGVATFYALLPTTPQPDKAVHICTNMACRFSGGEQLLQQAKTDFDASEVAVHASPCLGLCEFAPVAFAECAGAPANRFSILEATLAAIRTDLDLSNSTPEQAPTPTQLSQAPSQGHGSRPSQPQAAPAFSLGQPKLLKRIMSDTPTTLASYRASGGYQAFELARANGPQWVLEELEKASLLGRGGAAFPTAIKWRAVADAAVSERYLVANGDESEPGTFKDRVLMENDPFALIEAMTIAGYVTKAQRGYIYIRSEYPKAEEILADACAQAASAGLLGSNIAGSDFDFTLELRRGAGAYICGEETALLNSIEGYRGEPRNKPPFPAENGLFHKPTLVNNVETFANVLPILTEGGAAFGQIGTEASAGTRLFCLSGACAKPGVYEIPLGTTLKELLQLSQADLDAKPLVLLGGAAGAFVGDDQLDVPLSFEATAEADLTLGSGAVIVIPQSVDVADLIDSIAEFFVAESCGQCVPCRVGTVRQQESLGRLHAIHENGDRNPNQELEILADLDSVMTDASICSLGQTAASAIRSAIRLNLL